MLILNKDFYNLIKYSLYFGATIKNYPNSKWDCNFQTKVNYYTNILKIVPRYIKNLLKFNCLKRTPLLKYLIGNCDEQFSCQE